MSHYLRKRQGQQLRTKQRMTRQQLARAHRPMSQQVVEKILSRHGRQ